MARSILVAIPALLAARAASAADYPLRPVPFNEVEMTSDFWRPRLVTQRESLVPWAFEQTQPGVEHLKTARDYLAGKKVEGHRAHRFIDSDLYKVMEGAAYLLQLRRDPVLEARLDELADLIAAAQEEDGYLYPSHTTGVGQSKNNMGDAPYTFIVHSHELYNVGHMYEAAVAYYRATGKDKLLNVAEKSARHLNQVIFEGNPDYNDGKPIRQAPGHQELELALVKLFRVTGESLYLDMARKFLEIRGVTYIPDGEGVMAPTYAQQHAPVLEQTEAVGHAVRATYLYAGMADVGTLTDDPRYATALDRIWGDITNTRMHITGGLGAVHGIEGFGPQYELPNAHAFNETCAAVGNVLFNWRMFLLHKDAKYLDVAEVALLNNVLAAVNFEGNRFFYVNPLEADGKYPFNHGTAGRAPWFGTACCPSNMARLIPQVPGMTYAHDADNLFVTFYAESKTQIEMNGVPVAVKQQTAYPHDGEISVVLSPESPVRFRLRLRVPTWTGDRFVPGDLYRYAEEVAGASSPSSSRQSAPLEEAAAGSPSHIGLSVNGEPVPAEIESGFAVIDRRWSAGDHVRLLLPMPVRINECHPAVTANENRDRHDARPVRPLRRGRRQRRRHSAVLLRRAAGHLPGRRHDDVYRFRIVHSGVRSGQRRHQQRRHRDCESRADAVLCLEQPRSRVHDRLVPPRPVARGLRSTSAPEGKPVRQASRRRTPRPWTRSRQSATARNLVSPTARESRAGPAARRGASRNGSKRDSMRRVRCGASACIGCRTVGTSGFRKNGRWRSNGTASGSRSNLTRPTATKHGRTGTTSCTRPPR